MATGDGITLIGKLSFHDPNSFPISTQANHRPLGESATHEHKHDIPDTHYTVYREGMIETMFFEIAFLIYINI